MSCMFSISDEHKAIFMWTPITPVSGYTATAPSLSNWSFTPNEVQKLFFAFISNKTPQAHPYLKLLFTR